MAESQFSFKSEKEFREVEARLVDMIRKIETKGALEPQMQSQRPSLPELRRQLKQARSTWSEHKRRLVSRLTKPEDKLYR